MRVIKKIFLGICFWAVAFQAFASARTGAPTEIDLGDYASVEGTSSTNTPGTGLGELAIGDFNCDGEKDVVFGSAGYGTWKGRIYVKFGGNSFGTSSLTVGTDDFDVILKGSYNYDALGHSVVVTNVDDDVDSVTGYECDDIVVLSGKYGSSTDGGTDASDIYVYLGNGAWSGEYTNTAYSGSGSSVGYYYNKISTSASGASFPAYYNMYHLGPLDGDVSGDGVVDNQDSFLALCSAQEEKCLLLRLTDVLTTGTDIEDLADYTVRGNYIVNSITSGNIFGYNSTSGDYCEPLIVGDPDYSTYGLVSIFDCPLSSSLSDSGGVFTAGSVTGSDITIQDSSSGDFGQYIQSALLVNSNLGYEDLVIGSSGEDSDCGMTSCTDNGRVHFISSESLSEIRNLISSGESFSASGITFTYDEATHEITTVDPSTGSTESISFFSFRGDADAASLGTAGGSASGDINGDGVLDIMIGSSAYSDENSYGRNYFILGGSLENLLNTDNEITDSSDYGSLYVDKVVTGANSSDQLSSNVVTGDVTGDGIDDILIAAAGYNSGYGALYIIESNSSDLSDSSVTDNDGDGFAPVYDPDGDGKYESYDCNDNDETAYPQTWYADSDADGFGDSSATLESCTQPEGYVSDNTDCDDSDASNTEGFTWYRDNDSDGYGSLISTVACTAPANYVDNRTDCDDTNSGVNPDAAEICDGADNDCDATTPEDTYASDTSRWYRDADTDGYGSSSVSTTACSAPSGYVGNDSDCNDSSASAYPGNSETAAECEDGIDQNCDGADLACETAGPDDLDADGYISASDGGDDCDDTNSSVNPGAAEICDTLDNDCNSSTDEDLVAADTLTWYADEDGDGFGDAENSVTACTQPDDFVENSSDCADNNATVSPEGTEVCGDSVDQNCDGADLACASDEDLDDDGYASPEDCNDEDATVNPGAAEAGNALDDNCNGQIDEGLSHVTLAEIDETVSQGSRFDVKVNLSNESGFRNFRVVVMVQNKPMSSSAAKKMYSSSNNNLRLVPYFLGNTNCSDDGDCEEIYETNAYVSNSGGEMSYIFSPTMPSDKDDGKTYFVQVQFRDPETDAIIMQTQTASSFPNLNYKKTPTAHSVVSFVPTKLTGDESADPFITVE